MTDTRRTILERVASGELTPEEAAVLLDEAERGAPGRATTTTPEGAEVPPFESVSDAVGSEGQETVQRVRVVRNLGTARITGDPAVLEAVAEGPHRAERRGGVLVISDSVAEGGFVFGYAQRRGRWDWDRGRQATLSVRMRPDLPLEVQAQGGSVQVADVVGPIQGDVQAGMVNLQGARGPLDLAVQAGSLSVEALLDHGISKLRCEAGSIRVVLDPASSVRILAHSTLGHLSLPGGPAGEDVIVVRGGRRETTIGAGAGRLELEATLGSIRVSVE